MTNETDNKFELPSNKIAFSDIAIESQYSEITSRSEVDLTTAVDKNVKLSLPVISANMPDITEWKIAREMAIHGGLGIIHRFMTIEENMYQFKKALEEISSKSNKDINKLIYSIGVSVGVKEEDKQRFNSLYELGARIFCIDVAHGHHINMKTMLQWISKNYNKTDICIIAGNVATGQGAIDLFKWGASAVKIGIGPGSVCRTRSNTGVGIPQFSAIKECHEALKQHKIRNKCSLISDGGIKTTGDIAKALIYADSVMIGGALAGTSETPGRAFPVQGTDLTNRQFYKVYGGSASGENKSKNGNEARFVEGEMKTVALKGHAKYILREIKDGLQSSFSYSNAKDMKQYKENVRWHLISGGGQKESKVGE